jgi:hypothetical protein
MIFLLASDLLNCAIGGLMEVDERVVEKGEKKKGVITNSKMTVISVFYFFFFWLTVQFIILAS